VTNTVNGEIIRKSRTLGVLFCLTSLCGSLPVGSGIILAAAHTRVRIVAGIDKRKRSNRIGNLHTKSPYKTNCGIGGASLFDGEKDREN